MFERKSKNKKQIVIANCSDLQLKRISGALHPVYHYRHASERNSVTLRLMRVRDKPTRRKFTCCRINPACIMTRERDERNRYDLTGWQKPFSGPFHARFNRAFIHTLAQCSRRPRSLVRLFMAGRERRKIVTSHHSIIRSESVRPEIETFPNHAV